LNKKILVALGDSITYGWPYEQEFSWVNTLQQNLSNLCILNKGVSGDTFGDMLNRLEEDVLMYEPEYCIVMGGANEAYQHIPQPVLKENFLKIIKELKQIECKIIIGLPTPVDYEPLEKYLQEIREWLKDCSRQHQIPILDFYTLMLNKDTNKIDDSLFIDGCHPNKKGYQLMGQYALKTLGKLIVK
jgi:lysophospholipase L1-like esterase